MNLATIVTLFIRKFVPYGPKFARMLICQLALRPKGGYYGRANGTGKDGFTEFRRI